MVQALKQAIRDHGASMRILPVFRLEELRQEIGDFARHETLNGFQQYIVDKMYRFDIPDTGFDVASILMLAVPNPAYAKVVFQWQGSRYPVASLIRYAPGEEEPQTASARWLAGFLEPRGFHLHPMPDLPLKRLAVRSGLAVYGRNNITYVDGMGSFFTLYAYASDLPCGDGDWSDLRRADLCDGCGICLHTCPTGAIRADRFLIDNERCLSYFNEGPGDFPEWLSPQVHHLVYDCLECQRACPMDAETIGNVVGPVEFSEEETGRILGGGNFGGFDPVLQEKMRMLGMNQWMAALPRNLEALFQQMQ